MEIDYTIENRVKCMELRLTETAANLITNSISEMSNRIMAMFDGF